MLTDALASANEAPPRTAEVGGRVGRVSRVGLWSGSATTSGSCWLSGVRDGEACGDDSGCVASGSQSDVQSPLPQPDQQAPDQGGVLRRSLHHGERMLHPSIPIPKATTHRWSAKWTPSIMIATRSSPVRSAASRSASGRRRKFVGPPTSNRYGHCARQVGSDAQSVARRIRMSPVPLPTAAALGPATGGCSCPP